MLKNVKIAAHQRSYDILMSYFRKLIALAVPRTAFLFNIKFFMLQIEEILVIFVDLVDSL